MKQPSTRSLAELPSIDGLNRLSKSLAMLDAIMSPEWEHRYYSFDSRWGPNEMMASMRNGSGDEYFILFDASGVAIKGFDHESKMSPWRSDPPVVWPGMFDGIPACFAAFLNEPAFSINNVTYCIWRRHDDPSWQRGAFELPAGDDPDGSRWMLKLLGGDPRAYQEFARDYYEAELPLSAIERVYNREPLTDGLVRALNGECSIAELEADAAEIGYPEDGSVKAAP